MFSGTKRSLMKKLKNSLVKKTQDNRLYNIPIPIIGLTGGIASGKSTVAELLRKKNIPVIDADRLVKNIYQMPETKAFIKTHFSDAVVDNEIIFKKLREIAFSSESSKKILEDYIYALLPIEFKKSFSLLNSPSLLVYDVPLLFEKNLNDLIDISICVYTPQNIQIERLVNRDHISKELAENIINQQTDIEEKRKLADFAIINTSDLSALESNLERLVREITEEV